MFELITLLTVGFIILVKGADIFVESASNIACLFRVPIVIIGIVIIGFGTSLPELSVNISAILKGDDAIAVSNVVGSNIFNILFIIGTIALCKPIIIKKKMFNFEFPYLLIASAILLFCATNYLIIKTPNHLTFTDGIIFLCIFIVFLYQVFRTSIKRRHDKDEDHDSFQLTKTQELKVSDNIISVIVGVILVVYGGNMVIKESSSIALSLGLSKHFVGLTMVAIGTSLPEYITSIIAAMKNKQDIIIGNIIGSNVFNILLILGATTMIHYLVITDQMIIDVVMCLFSAILVSIIAFSRHKISRFSGGLLTAVYLAYFVYILLNR